MRIEDEISVILARHPDAPVYQVEIIHADCDPSIVLRRPSFRSEGGGMRTIIKNRTPASPSEWATTRDDIEAMVREDARLARRESEVDAWRLRTGQDRDPPWLLEMHAFPLAAIRGMGVSAHDVAIPLHGDTSRNVPAGIAMEDAFRRVPGNIGFTPPGCHVLMRQHRDRLHVETMTLRVGDVDIHYRETGTTSIVRIQTRLPDTVASSLVGRDVAEVIAMPGNGMGRNCRITGSGIVDEALEIILEEVLEPVQEEPDRDE